jgi:hypothetical protein
MADYGRMMMTTMTKLTLKMRLMVMAVNPA